MPFTLIKGEFVPQAGKPDGDSMRFRPNDPNPLCWLKRRGAPPKINQTNKTIQLRFEGIDTMESKAAEPFSGDATKSNLELCGISENAETAPGYILTNQIGPYGRPIAFVFSGQTEEEDGASIFLDAEMIRDSINFKQIQRGHAYPLFYDTLFGALRDELASAVQTARNVGENIWSADASTTGAAYSGRASLTSMPPIFPKLWRRLDSYSRDRDVMNPDSLDEFRAYLESIREERVFITSENRATGFDDVIGVDGGQVRLMYAPEDLIIVSV